MALEWELSGGNETIQNINDLTVFKASYCIDLQSMLEGTGFAGIMVIILQTIQSLDFLTLITRENVIDLADFTLSRRGVVLAVGHHI